jgi:hypothetical protein
MWGGALGCAASSVRSQCTNSNDCDPWERCENGSCVQDNADPDAGPVDAGVDAAPVDAALPDAAPPDAAIPCPPDEVFTFTETQESLSIPQHVRFLHVKLWGGGGNDEDQCPWSQGAGLDGGQGGYTEAIFQVSPGTALAPGTELVVIVGSAGLAGASASRFGFGVRGGGGLTGLFFGPGPIEADDGNQALAVAGGGGSAGAPNCHPGGPGNHPTAGGRADMRGGQGSDPDHIIGGGGGYEGGPGGQLQQAATGGSGYVDQTLAVDRRIHYAEPGDNPVPGSTDADYVAQGGTAGRSEQPGLAIVKFTCE